MLSMLSIEQCKDNLETNDMTRIFIQPIYWLGIAVPPVYLKAPSGLFLFDKGVLSR